MVSEFMREKRKTNHRPKMKWEGAQKEDIDGEENRNTESK